MDSPPEVSVVIPTRDRERLLGRALNAALHQREVELEVIVVDDGSRDGTADALERCDDARVKVVTHALSRGVAAARNAGIARARGRWVAFLDDDDLWSPHKLRTQLDAASGRDAAFVYGAAVDVDSEARVTRLDEAPPPDDLLRSLLRQNVIPAGSSNVIARLDLLRRLGGFDERLSQAADWELWIRLAGAGTAISCHEVLVAYSLHEENMLLSNPGRVLRELRYIAAKHRALAHELRVELDRSAYLRWVATGHGRAGRRLSAAAAFLGAAALGGGGRDVLRGLGALAGRRASGVARGLMASEVPGTVPPPTRPTWVCDDHRLGARSRRA